MIFSFFLGKTSILLVMIRILFLILTLNFIVGCADKGVDDGTPNPVPFPGVSQNPELSYYIEAFESLYSIDVNYSVEFDTANETGGSTTSGVTVGVCQVWTSGYKRVLINKAWWDLQADVSRKILMFHELGHCSLDRGHDNRRRESDNMPLSIMYPVINPIIQFYALGSAYQQYYEEELFANSPLNSTVSTMTSFSMSSQEESSSESHDHGDCVKHMD